MAVTTGKITISLPIEDLRMLAEYSNRFKLARSNLFRQAIKLWLTVAEKEEMQKKYISVYSNTHIRKKQVERIEEMLPLALEMWPEYQKKGTKYG